MDGSRGWAALGLAAVVSMGVWFAGDERGAGAPDVAAFGPVDGALCLPDVTSDDAPAAVVDDVERTLRDVDRVARRLALGLTEPIDLRRVADALLDHADRTVRTVRAADGDSARLVWSLGGAADVSLERRPGALAGLDEFVLAADAPGAAAIELRVTTWDTGRAASLVARATFDGGGGVLTIHEGASTWRRTQRDGPDGPGLPARASLLDPAVAALLERLDRALPRPLPFTTAEVSR